MLLKSVRLEILTEVCGWMLRGLVCLRTAQQEGTHERDPGGTVLELGSGCMGVGYSVLSAVV